MTRRPVTGGVFVGLTIGLMPTLPACTSTPEDAVTESLASSSDGSDAAGTMAPPGTESDDATTSVTPPRDRACPPPAGVSARPESIGDVVALLNALPLPTTLPCFLESLERPLEVAASTNTFSAQPADGPESPRLFLVSGPLTMSVVPTGIGQHLLELAVDLGDRESVKAEIAFPIEERLIPTDPYDRIRRPNGGTTCNNCHGGERPEGSIEATSAYASEALQSPEEHRLSVSFVRQHASACDENATDERCAILVALFLHGDVVGTTLPEGNRICRGL